MTSSLPKSPVGKLLLNAWSAEYALKITPTVADREFLNNALSWTFPQAYFAALFSARAVLAADGVNIANPETIEKLLVQWAQAGKYGPAVSKDSNPFADLMQCRPKGDQPKVRLSGPEAAALQVKLIEKVHAVGIIHETYILNRLGTYDYSNLIADTPQYLKDGFVGLRARFIMSED